MCQLIFCIIWETCTTTDVPVLTAAHGAGSGLTHSAGAGIRSSIVNWRGRAPPVAWRGRKGDCPTTVPFAGALYPLVQKLRLGQLPGDIVIERENVRVCSPLGASIPMGALPTPIFRPADR